MTVPITPWQIFAPIPHTEIQNPKDLPNFIFDVFNKLIVENMNPNIIYVNFIFYQLEEKIQEILLKNKISIEELFEKSIPLGNIVIDTDDNEHPSDNDYEEKSDKEYEHDREYFDKWFDNNWIKIKNYYELSGWIAELRTDYDICNAMFNFRTINSPKIEKEIKISLSVTSEDIKSNYSIAQSLIESIDKFIKSGNVFPDYINLENYKCNINIKEKYSDDS